MRPVCQPLGAEMAILNIKLGDLLTNTYGHWLGKGPHNSRPWGSFLCKSAS